MNKKLLALAIGAVVALPATALATGPTLYGQLDVSVESVDDETGLDAEVGGTAGTSTDAVVMRDNFSRIGVRGDAETNVGGLTAIYQAEFGVDVDNGFGGFPFTQRDIFVGLKGGFGTVVLGDLFSPFQNAQGTVDKFDDSTLDMGNHVSNESRIENAIQYTSPLLAELVTVTVAVTTQDIEGDINSDGKGDAGVSASAVYDKDGLYLAVASDDNVENEVVSGVTDLVSGDEVDAIRFVANYTTDSFEIGALLQKAEQNSDTPAGGGAVDGEDTSMIISGAYKTGDWKFKAQYGTTEGDVTDETVTSMAFGADYTLGKSTTVYALVGMEDADQADVGRDVFGVGIRQKF